MERNLSHDEIQENLNKGSVPMHPKVLRTHTYALLPNAYEIFCPTDKAHRTTWSEFESYLWCFECKEDIWLEHPNTGIFGGPIQVEVCQMILGASCFTRVNVKTGKTIKLSQDDPIEQALYNSTWVWEGMDE